MDMARKETSMQDSRVEPELEFSVLFRLQHWIRFISIVALLITGFYIADPMLVVVPSKEPIDFMNALFRSWHIIFAFLLIATVMIKIYIFIFGKVEERERRSFRDIWSLRVWLQQVGYYLLVSKRPKLRGAYNPIQFVAYIGFYLMLFGLIITGLILYANGYHEGLGGILYSPMKSIEVMLGGLAVVRELHHILMWGIIIFIVFHLYLVVYNTIFIKEGAMDAIFSGLKWHKKR